MKTHVDCRFLWAVALIICFSSRVGISGPVRVWEGEMTLPTYEEGLPDINPPFDLFQGRSFITYPYTTRENLTNRKTVKSWRTLNLENELLRVIVLPDLGGRLYSCVDKANGREMFYANPSIKYAQVAYRGAWVALGIEFNFPVSHNWMTVSPVDFGTVQEPDGGASIWVGNIDRPYGMMWRVALTLHPGSSLLEQTITLYNASDLRHRFYWWNTASVEVQDDSRILYPMEFTASHGFKDVDSWPVDSSGLDLSIPANHTRGFVSRFAHATREPFMGIYHPQTQSGVAHFAKIEEVPAKKIWSWGWDDEGKDWRRALSDNNSAYLEVQAGLFRNQETYAFLEPQQSLRFKEYWMPIRGIGGFSRVNPHGAIRLERGVGANGKINLRAGLNVTRDLSNGRLVLRAEDKIIREETISLPAAGAWEKHFVALDDLPAYTLELCGDSGEILLVHTENRYDWTLRNEVKIGPMPSWRIPPPQERNEGDWLELGRNLELTGKLLQAYDCYQGGIERNPNSVDLHRASGRLAVQLKRFAAAAESLSRVVARISNDGEALYYLGNADWFLGKKRDARIAWESAALQPAFRAASMLQLARLASQEGNPQRALTEVRKALVDSPRLLRAGCLEVALLRHLGEKEAAQNRLAYWQTIDPPNSFLRVEKVHWEREEESLWRHLAGDPERVLEIAVEYMKLGFYEDAINVLARQYPRQGVQAEPGTPLPQQYPLVAYYRGYCREMRGVSGREDFQQARGMSTRYVFPNRPESMAVLKQALNGNPADGVAHFLLGSLYLSGGMAEEAIREWEQARQLEPNIPVLHRNLGYACLFARREAARSLDFFKEGIRVDPQNVENYSGADQAMSLLGREPSEYVSLLKQFPASGDQPPALVLKLALALSGNGQFAEAQKLLSRGYFPREEFGTNVRQVYLEVLLQKALSLARQGKRQEALELADSMGKPVSGIPYTSDGLETFLGQARVQYQLGILAGWCGQEEQARKQWQAAAQARGGRQAPYALLAARRLGKVDTAAWEKRLGEALQELEDYTAGGGHFPGSAVFSQGMILQLLGRSEEATEKLRQVFYLPDKGMSHYLAREALRKVPSPSP